MLGAGRWGQLDLAGNLWQWNLDFDRGPLADPCTDCAILSAFPEPDDGLRVIQGGNFSYEAEFLLAEHRYENNPNRDIRIGFRCARAP